MQTGYLNNLRYGIGLIGLLVSFFLFSNFHPSFFFSPILSIQLNTMGFLFFFLFLVLSLLVIPLTQNWISKRVGFSPSIGEIWFCTVGLALLVIIILGIAAMYPPTDLG